MATRETRTGDRVRVGPLSACPSPHDPYLPGLRRHDPGEEGRTGTVLRVKPEPDPTHPFQVGFDAAGRGRPRTFGEGGRGGRAGPLTARHLCTVVARTPD
jgi:hypothetical protein